MQAIANQFLKLIKFLSDFSSKFRGLQFRSKTAPTLGQINHKLLGSFLAFIAIALLGTLSACSGNSSEITSPPKTNLSAVKATQSAKITISEVSPPAPIQKLSRYFDSFEPEVKIIEPKSDQILTDTKVSIKFDVKNLPIFKNPDLGLGTHIHVVLDNQEYRASYDLTQPVVFENLTAGTHTIRAFASRPWHESFKNEGAFAQTTFHVYTKTLENTPSPQLPVLTYSRPVGTYGAEPVMLDFYLRNTPLHAALLEESSGTDWQVRVTINNQSFNVDQWLPVYIKGLNPGLNWVKLEFLDAEGHLVPNQFNSTAHLINYQPDGTDTLSRLVRGETIEGIEGIVNPNYSAQTAKSTTESKIPEPEVKPEVKTPKSEAAQPEKIETKAIPPKVNTNPQVEPKLETKTIELAPPKTLETITPVKAPEIKPEIKLAPKVIETPKVIRPPVAPIPKITTPVTKLKISEPTAIEPFQPVEQIAKPDIIPTSPVPAVIAEPKTLNSEIPEPPLISSPESNQTLESAPKVFKGLDSLNIGERLKQARQKKASDSQPSDQDQPLLDAELEQESKSE